MNYVVIGTGSRLHLTRSGLRVPLCGGHMKGHRYRDGRVQAIPASVVRVASSEEQTAMPVCGACQAIAGPIPRRRQRRAR